MRLAGGKDPAALADRVVLVQLAAEEGESYQLKRLRRTDRGWLLASDRADGPAVGPTAEMTTVARPEAVVRPEQLAPPEATVLARGELADAFGLNEVEPTSGRYGGHLFVFVAEKEMLVAPDRLRYPPERRIPGETAYVLVATADGAWRYQGVGRWVPEENLLAIPEVDRPAWTKRGRGRGPHGACPSAQGAVLPGNVGPP